MTRGETKESSMASLSGTAAGESVETGTRQSWRDYAMQNIDPALSTTPLASFCFMTGFIPGTPYRCVQLLIALGALLITLFQLALALARLFSPGNTDFHFQMADRQALVSLVSFLGGASIGRIGDKMGNNTRLWLFLGTLIQALFTMAAAVTVWQGGQGSIAGFRGEPAWTNALSFLALAFASASIGLQGIMGKRVNSQFATTVVLTTVWCEFMSDPNLFRRRLVISRDHKVIAVVALFVGGFVGRAILDQVGSAGAFGVGTGMRVLIAIGWLSVPAKKVAPK